MDGGNRWGHAFCTRPSHSTRGCCSSRRRRRRFQRTACRSASIAQSTVNALFRLLLSFDQPLLHSLPRLSSRTLKRKSNRRGALQKMPSEGSRCICPCVITLLYISPHVLQDLELSVLRAKASLRVDDGAAAGSSLHSRDVADDFDTKSDAALQRMRVLLDFCVSEFSFISSPGRGWEGIVEDAKARLMHAQVLAASNRTPLASPPQFFHCFSSSCFR